MPHEYAGKYSTKHPAGTASNPAIADALKEVAEDGRVTCAAALGLATDFGVTPAEIGRTADLLECRITKCQLGLFGYSPEKRIVKAADHISEELQNQLQHHTADGRITCASCWKIAEMLGIDKMGVSGACERLKIKVKHCQVGAF